MVHGMIDYEPAIFCFYGRRPHSAEPAVPVSGLIHRSGIVAFYEFFPIELIQTVKIIDQYFRSEAVHDGVFAANLFRKKNPDFMNLSRRRNEYRFFPVEPPVYKII